MPLPVRKHSTQARKIELRERVLGANEIAAGPVKNRSRANKVVARLMMKGDRHLNQTLKMPAP